LFFGQSCLQKYSAMLSINHQDSLWENEARLLDFSGKKWIIGVDEVGRGCLAGPVTAAAVLFIIRPIRVNVKDSKAVSAKKREVLLSEILQSKLHMGIGFCSAQVIDEMNILNATKLAMSKAIHRCLHGISPNLYDQIQVCIDGNFTVPLSENLLQSSVIKGDSLIASIASASIVAKVTRDRYMTSISRFYPEYQLHQHKGYGTPQHYLAIQQFGLSDCHRRSFLSRIPS